MTKIAPLILFISFNLLLLTARALKDEQTIKNTPLLDLIEDNTASAQDIIAKINQMVEIETKKPSNIANLTAAFEEHLKIAKSYKHIDFEYKRIHDNTSKVLKELIDDFARLNKITQDFDNTNTKLPDDIASHIRNFNKLAVFNLREQNSHVQYDIFKEATVDYFRSKYVDTVAGGNSNEQVIYKNKLIDISNKLVEILKEETNYLNQDPHPFFKDYPNFAINAFNRINHNARLLNQKLTDEETDNIVSKVFSFYSAYVKHNMSFKYDLDEVNVIKGLLKNMGVKYIDLSSKLHTLQLFKAYFIAPKDIRSADNKRKIYIHNLFYSHYSDNILIISEDEVEDYINAYRSLSSKVYTHHLPIISFINYIGRLYFNGSEVNNSSLKVDFAKYTINHIVDFLALQHHTNDSFHKEFDTYLNQSGDKNNAAFFNILKIINAMFSLNAQDDSWKTVELGTANLTDTQTFTALIEGELQNVLRVVLQNAKASKKTNMIEYFTTPKNVDRQIFRAYSFEAQKIDGQSVSIKNIEGGKINANNDALKTLEAEKRTKRTYKVMTGELTKEGEEFILADDMEQRVIRNEVPQGYDKTYLVNVIPYGSDCYNKVIDSIIDEIKNSYI